MNQNFQYVATSLEDIAAVFDSHAKTAHQNQVGARTVKEGARYAGEACAWIAAAQILRQTTIKP